MHVSPSPSPSYPTYLPPPSAGRPRDEGSDRGTRGRGTGGGGGKVVQRRGAIELTRAASAKRKEEKRKRRRRGTCVCLFVARSIGKLTSLCRSARTLEHTLLRQPLLSVLGRPSPLPSPPPHPPPRHCRPIIRSPRQERPRSAIVYRPAPYMCTCARARARVCVCVTRSHF